MGGWIAFPTNGAEAVDIHGQGNETHGIQVNSELTTDLNVRQKAIKLQRICSPTEEFLEMTPETQSLKGKNLVNWTLLKCKTSILLDFVKRMNKQAID